mgnify:CR=1 FL=1
MAWIELHQSIMNHKKTRRLARALGLGVPAGIPQTIGHLCLFWLWCVDGSEDGCLADLDAQDIADAAGWTGDAEAFTEAMIKAEFIDRKPDGLWIHDWDDYIGRLLEKRKDTREKERIRKQKYRQRKRVETDPATPEEPPEDVPEGLYDPEWMKVVKAYEVNIGMLPMGTAGQMLVSYVDDLSADVVVQAIVVTNKAQASNPWKYLKAVLDKWAEQHIDTVEKAEAYCRDLERRLQQAKKQRQPATANEPPAITGDFY